VRFNPVVMGGCLLVGGGVFALSQALHWGFWMNTVGGGLLMFAGVLALTSWQSGR
jgi:hypothetical protein